MFRPIRYGVALVGLLAALTLPHSARAACTHYVDWNNGSDSNSGSSSSPWKTLQKAADLAQPGWTVCVRSGTYRREIASGDSQYDSGVMVIRNKTGTASAPIVFQAASGQSPKIDLVSASGGCNWYGILIRGSRYVTVDGFEIEGCTRITDLDWARARWSEAYRDERKLNNKGVRIQQGTTGAPSSHVVVKNNRIHGTGGSGINVYNSERVDILDNVIYDAVKRTNQAESAINLHKLKDVDPSAPGTVVVSGNRVYDNMTLVTWWRTSGNAGTPNGGSISDGNGIILDESDSGFSNYKGKVLIENNAIANNGGWGITCVKSVCGNVTATNNTIYRNNRNYPTNCTTCETNRITNLYNNVVWLRRGSPDLQGEANLFWKTGGLSGDPAGSNDYGDPGFVAAPQSDDDHGFNLRLASTSSPAFNTASAQYAPSGDAAGVSRPRCGADDRGAYEYAGTCSGASACGLLPTDRWFALQNRDAGLYLRTKDAGTVSGTPVVVDDGALTLHSQQWKAVAPTNGDGYCVLQNRDASLYLRTKDAGTAPGTPIVLSNGGLTLHSQQWKAIVPSNGDGTFVLKNRDAGIYMRTKDAGTAPGTPVVLHDGALTLASQQWRVVEVPNSAPRGVAAEAALPGQFAVSGPSPNPTRGGATVHLDLPQRAQVSAEVFDVLGRRVSGLTPSEYGAGAGQALRVGDGLTPGTYLVRVTAAAGGTAEVRTVRMTVAR